jgi:ribonuclease HI
LEEDLVAWPLEKNDIYSVRSCYRMLKKESDQTESFKKNEPNSSEEVKWWKKVWKLKVPPKVRMFWWRALQGFLPTKQELRRRHVAKEDHCESCGAPEESLFHVAITCTFVARFWRVLKDITGCKMPALHPATWTRDLLSGQHCTEQEAALLICGVWSLWTGRNNRRHGKNWSPVAASRHIALMVEDLICLRQETKTTPPGPKELWRKPERGWYKVNTDASFAVASNSGSGGVVVRDGDGKLVQASSKFYAHVPDVLTAEALAARDGVLLARASGYERVQLEMDNALLVNLLRSDAGERSSIAGLCHEISVLSREFVLFRVSFVNREGNEAANFCAKQTSASNRELSWADAFPLNLLGIAEADCNPAPG